MPTRSTIDQALLDDSAAYIATKIVKVIVNDTIEITNFAQRSSEDGEAMIEYVVTSEMTDQINKVELYSDVNKRYQIAAPISISITNEPAQIRHMIKFYKGDK